MNRIVILFLSLFLLLTITTVSAKTLTGKVIKVSDGDTIIIQTQKNKKLKIRLAKIDAPELAQPHGKAAHAALNQLLMAQNVKVEYKNKDRYQRIIGVVYLNGVDVGAEMVSQGHAWVYRQYSDDFYLYCLEYWARITQKGLWALPADKRTPPWEWRRSKLSLNAKNKKTYFL